VYEKVASDPAILGFKPWPWATEQPKTFGNDGPGAYNRSEHCKLLYKMGFQRRAELMEALFPLRTSQHIQCMSWPEVSEPESVVSPPSSENYHKFGTFPEQQTLS